MTDDPRPDWYDQGGYIPGGPAPVFIHPGEKFYTLQQARELLDRDDEDES